MRAGGTAIQRYLAGLIVAAVLASCAQPGAAPRGAVPPPSAPLPSALPSPTALTPSPGRSSTGFVIGSLPGPGTCPLLQGTWPNPACTTGAQNPAVTQLTIRTTICTSGWATRERDRLFPLQVSSVVKRALMAAENLTGEPSLYELDHFDPIEAGGALNDLRNLWVQPLDGTYGARAKDKEENLLHTRVCSGAMTVDEALVQVRVDWGGPPA